MVKIAFGFARRVGKDTSCDYLISKYGGVKLAFATPLYDILSYAQKKCGFEVVKDRKFLQFIGTEWARDINENVWVELLLAQVESKGEENIFVSDLRFKNEFVALKRQGFVCVHIAGKDGCKEEGGYANHQSDNDLIDCTEWDYILENKGSLDELYTKLDRIMQTIHNF